MPHSRRGIGSSAPEEKLSTQSDENEESSDAEIANLSHELRSPLNAILGLSRLLSREPGLSAKGRQRAEAIEGAGQHLLHLVDAFLTAAEARSREFQTHLSPASTVSLVEDVVAMFESDAQEKGVDLSFRVASDTPSHVLADHGKIRQILINLVGNAVKYTKQGRISVLVKASNPRDDECMLQMEVMDTGPGIAPDELKGIFARFARGTGGEEVQGVGLGLAISKHNARILGGTLSVESRCGRGSVFRLEVPVTWLHYSALSLAPSPIADSSQSPSHRSGTFEKSSLAASLDPDVIDAYLAAARAGDQAELFRLMERSTDALLASQLRGFVESYDYEGLIEFLSGMSKLSGVVH